MDVAFLNEGNNSTKTCFTIFFSLQFVEEFSHIGLRVVSLSASIASTIDTWFAVKCVHFETSIIGKYIYMIMVVDVLCFLQRILFQCFPSLRNISMTTNITQRQHLYPTPKNLSNF